MDTDTEHSRDSGRGDSTDEKLLRLVMSNGMFFRRLVHDLRNYVAPIGNVTQLLRLKVGDNADLLAVVQIIDRQLARIVRLSDRIAIAEHMFRDDQQVPRDRIAVDRLLTRIEEIAGELESARRTRVNISIGQSNRVVVFNEQHLFAALEELLQNASSYAQVGAAIWIEGEIDGNTLVISIRDEGEGLTTERLDELLAHSQGLDVPQLVRSTGLGLGLAIVQKAMVLSGGKLSARSGGLCAGSTFSLHLPLEPLESEESGPDLQSDTRSNVSLDREGGLKKRSQRVMIIDDNHNLRAALIGVIAECGHSAKGLSSGEEGLVTAQSWRPDLILIDLHLPGIHGLEIVRRLRYSFPNESLTLVLMTGDEINEALRSAAHLAGAQYCVGKLDSGPLVEKLLGWE